MKKAIIFLSILMIISFALSTLFFFNSGVFDFNYGYVTGENAKGLNLELGNFFSSKFGGESCNLTHINQTLIFDTTNIENIKVSSISTDIKIGNKKSNKATFNLAGTGCNQKLNSSRDESNLDVSIVYPLFKSWISKLNTNLVLTIYLPENYSNNLVVNSISGDVYQNSNNLSDCSIESVSGDLKLNNLYCNNLILKTTSGDINLLNGRINNAKTISGDINLERIDINNDLNLKTVSGDVNIYPTKDSKFEINFNTISGDLNKENSYGPSTNKVYVKTTSGDLKIL